MSDNASLSITGCCFFVCLTICVFGFRSCILEDMKNHRATQTEQLRIKLQTTGTLSHIMAVTEQ